MYGREKRPDDAEVQAGQSSAGQAQASSVDSAVNVRQAQELSAKALQAAKEGSQDAVDLAQRAVTSALEAAQSSSGPPGPASRRALAVVQGLSDAARVSVG